MTTNELTLNYYNIAISAAGLGGPAPKDGFIDSMDPRAYSATVGYPTTTIGSLAKTRAFLRYKEILQEIGLMIEPQYTLDIVATGATPDIAATSISFTVVFDRVDYLSTSDELNPGIILMGVAAIKRAVARALCATTIHRTTIFDPSAVKNYEEQINDVNVGPLAASITAAEANITVVQVANT